MHGVITIEFALILPALLLIIMGTLELGLVALAQGVLESAVNSAARVAKVGTAGQGQQTREDVVKEEIDRIAGPLMKSSDVTVTSTAYKDYSFAGGAPGVGGAGDVVVIKATYPWQIYTPVIGKFFSNPYPITAEIAIRNEPF